MSDIVIPDALKPATAGSAPARRRSGRRRWPLWLPPARRTSAPRTGRRPSRTSYAGCAPGWPTSSRCPRATRSCSATAAPRRSGTSPCSTWCASARSTWCSASSRPSSRPRPRPRRSSPTRASSSSEPGTHPLPRAEPGIDVYAFTHNETSTGVAMPLHRVEGADDGALVLVDATSGAGGLPVDVAETDVYYFAPQKSFASDGGLWLALMSPAAIERVAEVHGNRSLGAGVQRPADRHRQLAAGPDLQHPGAGHALPARRAARLVQLAGRPGLGDRAHRGVRGRLYTWAEKSEFATAVRHRPVAALRSGRHHRLRRQRSTQPPSRRRCAPTASSTPSPYRKLGRNQLRVAMFPAVEPDDVEALTACIDHVVAALAT